MACWNGEIFATDRLYSMFLRLRSQIFADDTRYQIRAAGEDKGQELVIDCTCLSALMLWLGRADLMQDEQGRFWLLVNTVTDEDHSLVPWQPKQQAWLSAAGSAPAINDSIGTSNENTCG